MRLGSIRSWTAVAVSVALAVVPTLSGTAAVAAARHGPSAGLLPSDSAVATAQYQSQNWAGYFVVSGTSGSVSKVAGAWIEPSVKCPSTGTTVAAFWVGIDGAGTSTVQQTGTDAECSAGRAYYVAWWELYPLNAAQPISSIVVHPGDHFTASVTYASGGYTMTIHDTTTGKGFSKTATQSGTQRRTAECITERPAHYVNGKLVMYQLADFGTVPFSSCGATISGRSAGIGSFSGAGAITMVDSSGKVLARPSALSGNSAFSVAWKASS